MTSNMHLISFVNTCITKQIQTDFFPPPKKKESLFSCAIDLERNNEEINKRFLMCFRICTTCCFYKGHCECDVIQNILFSFCFQKGQVYCLSTIEIIILISRLILFGGGLGGWNR